MGWVLISWLMGFVFRCYLRDSVDAKQAMQVVPTWNFACRCTIPKQRTADATEDGGKASPLTTPARPLCSMSRCLCRSVSRDDHMTDAGDREHHRESDPSCRPRHHAHGSDDKDETHVASTTCLGFCGRAVVSLRLYTGDEGGNVKVIDFVPCLCDTSQNHPITGYRAPDLAPAAGTDGTEGPGRLPVFQCLRDATPQEDCLQ